MSHPSWVCGLKLSDGAEMCDVTMSHPSWVCGLKHQSWQWSFYRKRHTLRGCVD